MTWGPGLLSRSCTHLGSPANWSDLCEGQILLHRLSVWTGCREHPHSTLHPSHGACGSRGTNNARFLIHVGRHLTVFITDHSFLCCNQCHLGSPASLLCGLETNKVHFLGLLSTDFSFERPGLCPVCLLCFHLPTVPSTGAE